MRYSLLLALLFGCSAIVNPDGTRLGSGERVDSGRDGGADGGLDGGGVDSDIDSGCTAAPSCDGATRVFCMDGRLRMENCPDGCEPSSGMCIGAPTGFQPSNVERDQFRMDAPDLVLDRSGSYDTSECDPTSGVARVVRLADGSEACVLSLGDFRIESDASFRVIGERALIVVSSGEIRIDGVLDASARGAEPGPGGFHGGGGGLDGEGPGGGGAGDHSERFSDGGGGGGGACGIGGGGGRGVAEVGGGDMDASGGTPGAAWPGTGADFQPLIGGSGGGGGQGAPRGGGSNAGRGGGGGGAVQLTALDSVRVRGTLLVGGGGGQAGQALGGNGVNWGSGGGGGSGGTVLLEAPVVRSTGVIALTGGGGGGVAEMGLAGSPGHDGRLEGRAPGGSPGGGAGAGEGSLAGAPGEDGEPPPSNGGGGGGGGGCLVVRSDAPPATGTLNPSASRPTLRPLRR